MIAQSLQEHFAAASKFVTIGEGTYGDLHIFNWDEKTKLKIGNYSSFSFGVKIFLGGEHNTEWVSTYPFHEHFGLPAVAGHPKSRGDINIGSDVWVGAEAAILSGVTIGHGAVVGARSIVTRDVAPFQIVAGSPAVPVGSRFLKKPRLGVHRADFEREAIERRLLEIAWWDWPTERVKAAAPLLMQPDIEKFLTAVEKGEI